MSICAKVFVEPLTSTRAHMTSYTRPQKHMGASEKRRGSPIQFWFHKDNSSFPLVI